jgi:hypothetical protein
MVPKYGYDPTKPMDYTERKEAESMFEEGLSLSPTELVSPSFNLYDNLTEQRKLCFQQPTGETLNLDDIED